MISKMSEENYLEYYLSYLFSPVITGIKPAITLNFDNKSAKKYQLWQVYGHGIIKKYQLESIILKESRKGCLLLIYHRANLIKYLSIKENKEFLQSLGYDHELILTSYLTKLKKKLLESSFPHEIGIFLGIPVEDVLGFINKEKCLYSGYWKVYSNCARAKKVFSLYEKSRAMLIASVVDGKNITYTIQNMANIFEHEL